ncbi:MAG TPA: DUF1549 domain-containing protein, partial [Urbifossiella sp.]|nr:DUF1549 domain-containing protein [Urbifossiella sp.]
MAAPPDGPVDFNRHVRPILSEFCFACHGPADQGRKADLRLDQREDALAEAASGRPVIHPGDPDGSELIARVRTTGPGLMPPRAFGKTLTAAQIDTLRRWVAGGAGYTGHWAYTPPAASAVPGPGKSGWVRNPIDAFILARLAAAGLGPSPEAARPTLIRRVSLALTGLPPSPAEVDAFVRDSAPDAYERLVDRLLASPHYGERMAVPWLDLARYADTNGGTADTPREMWRYRDWVVRALNENMPFDRFTVEQLAGDRLPDASVSARIATGFLRNETNQSDVCPDHRATIIMVDRVNTVSTVWLGLTAGCAQCHDHKYDPLTQREYYQIMAYFNNYARNQGVGTQDGRGNLSPVLDLPRSPADTARVADLRGKLGAVNAAIATRVKDTRLPDDPPPADHPEFIWVGGGLPPGAAPLAGTPAWDFVTGPAGAGRDDTAVRLTDAGDTGYRSFTGAPPFRLSRGDVLFAHVYLDPANPAKEVLVQFSDASHEHRAYWGENRIPWGQDESPGRRRMGTLREPGRWVRLGVPVEAIGLADGAGLTGLTVAVSGGTAFCGAVGVSRSARAVSYAAWEEFERDRDDGNLPPHIATALRAGPGRAGPQEAALRAYYIEHVYAPVRAEFVRLYADRDRLQKEVDAAAAEIPSAMVMDNPADLAPTYVLTRGDYAAKGEQVGPGVPAFLPPLPPGAKPDRLAFARWLTAPGHPLTARVAVNRAWELHF